MKAKEYFVKYKDAVLTDEWIRDILVSEFDGETNAIQAIRKGVTMASAAAVIVEQNGKWNALRRLFVGTKNEEALAYDGYVQLWMERTKASSANHPDHYVAVRSEELRLAVDRLMHHNYRG